jgi:PE family
MKCRWRPRRFSMLLASKYQELLKQAAVLQEQFAAALTASGNAFAEAEAAVSNSLVGGPGAVVANRGCGPSASTIERFEYRLVHGRQRVAHTVDATGLYRWRPQLGQSELQCGRS